MLRPRGFAVVVAVLALAITPAIALGSSARTDANSTTYPDSIGENPLAPDITSTTVSNDDSANITFKIAIANRPTLTDDMVLLVFLDTDQNTATGDPQSFGADYALQLVTGSVDLFHWSGSDYTSTTAPSLTYQYDSTGATIHINAIDLGKTKAFNFVVLAISGFTVDANGNPDNTNAHSDASPDPGHGTFSYQVLVKVSLSLVAFTTSPKPPKAGKPFSVGLAANESDTQSAPVEGTIVCVAKIAGKQIPLRTHRIVNGIAVCAWSVPKTATGKRIAGSISLTVQGATVTRSFSQTIS